MKTAAWIVGLMVALTAGLLAAGTVAQKVTFITKEVAPNGALLVEPIYPAALLLEPRNTVARQIRPGEALACTTALTVDDAEVHGAPARVHTIWLDCDGARFSVLGIQFERN